MDAASAAAQVVRVVDDCLAISSHIGDLLTAHPDIGSGAAIAGVRRRLQEIHDVYASEKVEALIELRGQEGVAVLDSNLRDEYIQWTEELCHNRPIHFLQLAGGEFTTSCDALDHALDTLSLPDASRLEYLASYPGQQVRHNPNDTEPSFVRNHRRMIATFSALGAMIALFGAVQLREQLGVPLFGIELGVFTPNPGHAWNTRVLVGPLCAYLSGLNLLIQNRGYAGDQGKLLAFWLGYEVAYLQGWWDGLEPTALLLGYAPTWILVAQVVCWAANSTPAIRRLREREDQRRRAADELV